MVATGAPPDTQGQTNPKRFSERTLGQRFTDQRDAALFRRRERPNRPPDDVFDRLLKSEEIGSAKAIVLITRQQPLAIDIRSAERPLEVKRHPAAI